MNFNGLSLDQAPPIFAPLRFFLTAPIFGILAGLFILIGSPDMFLSRFSIDTIIFTHMITIGFFALVMLGALTQMLPVLAGVKMFMVDKVTKVSHVLLVFGLICMIIGLKMESIVFINIASFGLGIGFLSMISMILFGIKGVKNFTPTVIHMTISLFFAFFIVLFGLFLLHDYTQIDQSEFHLFLANIHSVWAIFGFSGILIIGVSFQILPMFYVSEPFKNFFTKTFKIAIVLGLIFWFITNFYFLSFIIVVKLYLSLLFMLFSIEIWDKIKKRKRPINDITIWYWKAASLLLFTGSLAWLLDAFFYNEYSVIVGVLIGGFIFSVMQGMMYKIVPFLVWFHLNGRGYMQIPTMNEMIDKRFAKTQYVLFYISLFFLIISFFMPSLLNVFAFTFIASMMILQYNLISAVKVYVSTMKTKPDFDMSAFK